VVAHIIGNYEQKRIASTEHPFMFVFDHLITITDARLDCFRSRMIM